MVYFISSDRIYKMYRRFRFVNRAVKALDWLSHNPRSTCFTLDWCDLEVVR